MKKHIVFLICLLVFAFACGLFDYFSENLSDFRILLALMGAFFVSVVFVFLGNTKLKIIGIFICVFACAFFRVIVPIFYEKHVPISMLNDKDSFSISCEISLEPLVKQKNTELIMQNCFLDLKDTKEKIAFSGKLLVYTSRYQEFEYKDRVLISGKINSPQNFAEDFDFVGYLATKEIYSVSYSPYMKLEKRGSGFLHFIFGVKNKFGEAIDISMHLPASGFIKMVLFGGYSNIDKDIIEEFRSTGTLHLVAISGINISIISAIILSSLRFINRTIACIFVVIFLFIYIFLAGISPSVTRASITGIIVLCAQMLGRRRNFEIFLALTMALMVGLNPQVLFKDIGFQLSFLATIGIVYLSSLFKNFLKFLPSFLEFRESISATMSASIVTLPITIYYFGYFSAVSFVGTFILELLMPFFMIAGFILGFVSSLNSFIGRILGVGIDIGVRFELFIMHWLAKIKYCSWNFGEMKFWQLIVWLVLICGIIVFVKFNKKWKFRNSKLF